MIVYQLIKHIIDHVSFIARLVAVIRLDHVPQLPVIELVLTLKYKHAHFVAVERLIFDWQHMAVVVSGPDFSWLLTFNFIIHVLVEENANLAHDVESISFTLFVLENEHVNDVLVV